jgi:AraC-like DNA-binding protein
MKIFPDRHLLMPAWTLLRDPSQRRRKISDIATASGFSNISNFNRAFRSRFGANPEQHSRRKRLRARWRRRLHLSF